MTATVERATGGSMSPLMLHSLGRSGSTILLATLAQHPRVVGGRPFGHEVRLLAYWGHRVREAVPDEAAQSPSLMPRIRASEPVPGYLPLDSLQDLLGAEARQQVMLHARQAVAEAGRTTIKAFYGAIATEQRKAQPMYFVEKSPAPSALWPYMEPLFPAWRHIFLLRDPRAVFASIVRFDAKRGMLGFGQKEGEAPVQFARHWVRRAIRMAKKAVRAANQEPVIRFEELMQRPAEIVADVLVQLGLQTNVGEAQGYWEAAQKWTKEFHRTGTHEGGWGGGDVPDAAIRIIEREALPYYRPFGYG